MTKHDKRNKQDKPQATAKDNMTAVSRRVQNLLQERTSAVNLLQQVTPLFNEGKFVGSQENASQIMADIYEYLEKLKTFEEHTQKLPEEAQLTTASDDGALLAELAAALGLESSDIDVEDEEDETIA